MSHLIEFESQYQYASGFQLNARFQTDASVTALFGPSGSGKTTMLNVMAGLIQPKQHRFALNGNVLSDSSNKQFVPPHKRRIGFLFQEPSLFSHMTVQKNIEYGKKRRGKQDVGIDKLLELFEIENLVGRFPNTLSGGQAQRVALARVLNSSPDLLLLDEPLTAVESSLQNQITDLLQQVIKEFGIPTVLVTHNQSLVEQLAEKTLHVEHGVVLSH